MFRKIAISAVSALILTQGAALAEGATVHIEDHAFAHEGPFGKFDEFQLQRGLQVYTEVCSACHGLQYVPVRTLSDEGGPNLPEDQVRAYARDILLPVLDPATGEERPRETSDRFPTSQMEGAPDLSLMTKARAGFHGPYGTGMNQLFRGMGGAEYTYSILTGYEDPPACAPDDQEGYYNVAFENGGYPDSCKIYEDRVTEKTNPDGTVTEVTEKVEVGRQAPGSWINMPPPLADDLVTYADGHEATEGNLAEDVTSFLVWAAEPKMMARKQAGLTAVIFLTILSVLLYLTNKRLWAGIKGRKQT